MTPQTDQQLLASYLQGSHDAFHTLITRYAGLIFSTASRQAPPHLAEDITQAVFLLLAQRAHTLRNPQLLPAWLLKVTHFCAADARRADLRRKHHEQKAAAMATPLLTTPPSPDPLEPHLDAALQSLSPPDRTALLLRFYNDNSLAQIATSLNISEEAAKKRVARALQKLRKYFTRKNLPLALPLLTASLAATLTQHAHAAPPALITKIAALALTKSATTTSTLIAKGALKLMAYTTAKWTAAATASLLLLTTLTAVIIHSNTASPLPSPPPAAVPITPVPATLPALNPISAPANSITIEVQDMATHLPLQGVQVQLQLPFPANVGPAPLATTSDQGTLALPIPPAAADRFSIIARKPGYVPAQTYSTRTFPNDLLPEKISLQLEKATTIGGRVLADNGTPLDSAVVQVIVLKQYPSLNQNIPWDLQTTTNAQGQWTLNAIPEQCDKIEVAAYHKSCITYGFPYGPETSIPSLRNRTAITTLKSGTPLHVLVKDTNGKSPIAWIGLGDQRVASNIVPEFLASPDGSFDFVPPPDRPLSLTIHAQGYATQVTQCTPGDTQPLLITLQPATPLHVRILDSNHNPIPNALLTLDYYISKAGHFVRGINKSFLTSTDGQISWNEASNETLYVNITAPGYLSQSDLPITPGQSNTITLLPRFIIHATVIDDDTHLPAKNFRVAEGNFDSPDHKNIRYSDFPEWPSTHIRNTGPGTFDFTNSYQHDSFLLRILDGNYEPTDSPLITTNGCDQSLTLHVHKGRRLAGQLLDTDGNPLPKTYVYLQIIGLDIYDAQLLATKPGNKGDYDESPYFALTDASGNFSFPPQSANFTLIASNDSGYAITRSNTFNETNTLQLTPWAKIEGTLLINGNPAPNAPVSADYNLPLLRDESDPYFHFHITTTTDPNGHFSFPKIFAGPISLGPKTITTKPNQTTTITLQTYSP